MHWYFRIRYFFSKLQVKGFLVISMSDNGRHNISFSLQSLVMHMFRHVKLQLRPILYISWETFRSLT